ncbi:MAG: acyltransferase [Pseudomonadota bacterium]
MTTPQQVPQATEADEAGDPAAIPFPHPAPVDVAAGGALVPDAATPAPPARQPRYAHVDSLRAIAALLVLWAHTAEIYATLGLQSVGSAGVIGVAVGGQWMNAVAHSFDFGRMGVVLFFAISGFVIPASLKGTRADGLRRFAISRFFRLYPAYWFSIPLGAITFYWIWGKPFSAYEFALNFTMLPGALHVQPAEGLYWTLATELQFYCLCAVLFAVGGLRRIRVLAGLTVVFALVFAKYGGASRGLLGAHLSIMLFGTLCRYYLESDRQARRSQLLGIFLLGYALVWAALPFVAVWQIQAGRWSEASLFLYRTYAIGLGIFCVGLTAVRIRWRFAAWMGEISYSLYLLHPVVLYGFFWLLLHYGPAGLYGLHLGVYVGAVAATTVLLSALNYHYLEKPAIRLGKYFAHRTPANLARATPESFP